MFDFWMFIKSNNENKIKMVSAKKNFLKRKRQRTPVFNTTHYIQDQLVLQKVSFLIK